MFRNILYSFPAQLLINHLRENKVLLFFWAVLFGAVTGNLGDFLELHQLILDPEYLGESGFWSFFILGMALGGFTVAFHITTYIIDIHKFPFVGALSSPFSKFCLNNSIIPLAFLLTYLVCILQFQWTAEYSTTQAVIIKVLGLFTGLSLIFSLTFVYMKFTHKDVFQYLAQSLTQRLRQAVFYRVSLLRRLIVPKRYTFKVHTYLETPFQIGYTQDLDKYYDKEIVLQIFNQNHFTLLIFELIAIGLLFTLSILSYSPFSQIPAAASGILFLAILVMLTGFISFWAKRWIDTVIIAILITLNLLTKRGLVFNSRENHAFGLRYNTSRAAYSLEQVHRVNSREHYSEDKEHTLKILDNWRRKFPISASPKLVIICASGGGQRAALWTMKVLQEANSLTQGKLMEHTMLMSCVSGGALGAGYFRELYLRSKQKEPVNLYDLKYLDNIARDSLNPIVFSLVTNDILFDFNKFNYNGISYRRDRGYAIEDQVNKHTDFMMDKPLKAYKEPEFNSLIPMMILTPTIINDGNKLFISPHQVSYMSTGFTAGKTSEENKKLKGIDFIRFFKDQGAEDLRFLSALRMNATFPYVLPSVALPSTPTIEVMDAGLFDNFGVTGAVQFLYVFSDWIAKNTSGAVLLSVRVNTKEQELTQCEAESLFQKLTKPASIYKVWANMQDIRNDGLIELANAWLQSNIVEVEFQYTGTKIKKQSRTGKVSLGWHLTTEEKLDILEAIDTRDNQKALHQLKALF